MEKPAESKEPSQETDAPASGFASVEVFGEMPPKVDAEYTIRIKAIDPESREAEFEVVGGGEEQGADEPTETPAAETAETPMEMN
jgi:hypothetical protein